MAADEVTPYLHLEVSPDTAFGKVIEAEGSFFRLVKEVAHEVTERRDPFQWVLVTVVANGALRFRITPASDDGSDVATTGTVVVDAVASGIVKLGQSAERPDYFNDVALNHALELAGVRSEIGRVGIMNGAVGSELTDSFAQNVSRILEPAYSDYGTVEGNIEGVIVHSNRYFNVYDALTDRRVRCNFGHRIDIEVVKAALERRGVASGLIHYRPDGEPISMEADELRVFPFDADLPTASDVRGTYH